MKISDKICGFILKDIEPISELNVTAYRFRHEKSGADLLWLSCDDENRTFSISFKTLPEDSTGVFHILEHSVLNGSKKYPLREPFVDLIKGSMQTFLNAMTFPDKTMYPIASTNEKDFVNLMDVYLDAVLNPRIYEKEEIFLQEGWHYTPAADGAEGGFSGVVYNEMKGAYSSPDSRIFRYLQAHTYPGSCYSHSSGGDPECIPQLTYEQFLNTHKKFYHPENSYIYLYGKLDIENILSHIDTEYLCNYRATGLSFDIPPVAPIGEHTFRHEYELPATEELAGNTLIARGTSLCDFSDRETIIAADILLNTLTASNASPLKAAMLEAKLGTEFSAFVYDGIRQPTVVYLLKKSDPEMAEKFLSVLRSTLEKLAEEGVDKTLLEATLNQKEFAIRELDLGYAPGVSLAMMAMDSWLYGGNPTDALKNSDILARLRRGIHQGYFEDLIRRCLLAVDHAVTVILAPSHEAAALRIQREKEASDAYGASLGEEGLKANEEKLSRLAAYQSTEDTPEAKECLPHLELSDIRREIISTPVSQEVCGGIPTRLYTMPTNGIGYLRLYFDCSHLTAEELKYLSLANELLYSVGTSDMSTLQYTTALMLNTGRASSTIEGYTHKDGTYHPLLTVSASFLSEKKDVAMGLVMDGLTKINLIPGEVEQHLRQDFAMMEQSLVMSGNMFASLRAGGALFVSQAVKDLTHGVGFYQFLKEECGKLPGGLDELISKTVKVLRSVVCCDNLTVSYVGTEEMVAEYRAVPVTAPDCTRGGDATFAPYYLTAKEQAIQIPGGVAYNAIAGDMKVDNIPFSGKLLVLSRILSLDYLWNRVRMRGGAYGCGASIDREGALRLSSFRDPNVTSTYETYRAIPEYLREFEATTSDMTRYIIGAFSDMDRPLRPREQAVADDMAAFADWTDADRQMVRDSALTVTKEDIKAMAEPLAKVLEASNFCTVGAKEQLQESSISFSEII